MDHRVGPRAPAQDALAEGGAHARVQRLSGWSAEVAEVAGARALRCAVFRGAEPARSADVVAAWQSDAAFRDWFNATLARVPFAAFRWETPGLTAATVERAFEFAVVDSPELERAPEPEAFAEQLAATPSGDVLAFPNLGGDAVLVVPRALAAAPVYAHLGAFVRGAPASQRDALWQLVGAALSRRLGAKPVWLSTAGAGVAWLHVRLDDRPKYYAFTPYRACP